MDAYPRVQSVGIVVLADSKVLLVRHGNSSSNFEGIIGLPAGKIDRGESARDAAQRELREETGLICTQSDLLPLPQKYEATIKQRDGIKIFDWYVFACRKYEGNLKETSETQPYWCNLSDLPNIKTLPNVKKAIAAAQILIAKNNF